MDINVQCLATGINDYDFAWQQLWSMTIDDHRWQSMNVNVNVNVNEQISDSISMSTDVWWSFAPRVFGAGPAARLSLQMWSQLPGDNSHVRYLFVVAVAKNWWLTITNTYKNNVWMAIDCKIWYHMNILGYSLFSDTPSVKKVGLKQVNLSKCQGFCSAGMCSCWCHAEQALAQICDHCNDSQHTTFSFFCSWLSFSCFLYQLFCFVESEGSDQPSTCMQRQEQPAGAHNFPRLAEKLIDSIASTGKLCKIGSKSACEEQCPFPFRKMQTSPKQATGPSGNSLDLKQTPKLQVSCQKCKRINKQRPWSQLCRAYVEAPLQQLIICQVRPCPKGLWSLPSRGWSFFFFWWWWWNAKWPCERCQTSIWNQSVVLLAGRKPDQ